MEYEGSDIALAGYVNFFVNDVISTKRPKLTLTIKNSQPYCKVIKKHFFHVREYEESIRKSLSIAAYVVSEFDLKNFFDVRLQ